MRYSRATEINGARAKGSNALVWLAAMTLLGSACGDDSDPGGGADSTGGDDTTTTNATTGSTISATGMADATAGLDSTGNGTTTTTGMADGSFLDPDSSGDGGPMPQPNGAQCDDAAACESEFCYQIPMLGGVCSECLVDTDCEMGTCSLDPAGYAVCTDGGIGVMCNTDEGCMGELICSELIDTGGLFNANFCSECRDDVPCAGDQICSPVYDLGNFAGYLGCVDPGSVPNGGGCPLDGVMGDGAVCQSGLCGVATLGGFIPVGVCGECLTDMDCMDMGLTTCQPAAADMGGLQGAVCM